MSRDVWAESAAGGFSRRKIDITSKAYKTPELKSKMEVVSRRDSSISIAAAKNNNNNSSSNDPSVKLSKRAVIKLHSLPP